VLGLGLLCLTPLLTVFQLYRELWSYEQTWKSYTYIYPVLVLCEQSNCIVWIQDISFCGATVTCFNCIFFYFFLLNLFAIFHFFLQTTHTSHHMHRTRQTYNKCKWQLLLFVWSAHNNFFSEINCNCSYHLNPPKPLYIYKYIN